VPGLRDVIALVTIAVVFVACGAPSPTPTAGPSHGTGGTLRIGVVDDVDRVSELVHSDMGRLTEAMFARCCLARALLTYPGRATTDGGTVLLPDLAEEMPQISADGLTWTFRIRDGVHYAPPHENLVVTSADFITAVERSIRINRDFGYVFPPYQFVAGAQEYFDGTAATVSGLQAPDPGTLVVRLTRPSGALDFVADASWAPIPASVAAGHDDDLGLYWASTGPYMYGTYPADPGAGTVVLVRNPSWSAGLDPTRHAEVDRIEIAYAGADLDAALARVEAGEIDFVSQPLDIDATNRYRSDPQAILSLRSTTSEFLYRLPMNLAVPPFDDAAVRRAVAYALDRTTIRDAVISSPDAFLPRLPTVLSQHMFSDSVTGGLLSAYDPFGLDDGHGNISRARVEMRNSRYDSDGDGVCDASVCERIEMPSFDLPAGAAVAAALEPLGLNVEPVAWIEGPDGNDMAFPQTRTAISVLPYAWLFELTGTELSILVKGGPGLVGPEGFAANASLVGALPTDLERWGYGVTAVPSVDDLIERCDRELGSRRARCWAELDQVLAEVVIPYVPLFAAESVWLASPRVAGFSLDQATARQFPAFDKVRLIAGSD